MNPLQEFLSQIEQDLDSTGFHASNIGRFAAIEVDGRRTIYKTWQRITHPPEISAILRHWWLAKLKIPF